MSRRNFHKSASGLLLPDASIITPKIIESLESVRGGGVFQLLHQRGSDFDQWSDPEPNIVVDTGLVYQAGVALLASVSKITSWYVSAYKNNYSPVAGDTGALTNFTEIVYSGTDVSQSARPAYTGAAGATAGTLDNAASLAELTITNATPYNVYGSFVVSASSGTGGTLFSAALFSGGREVQNGDTLYLKYSYALANA
jgi:hypothetical protein